MGTKNIENKGKKVVQKLKMGQPDDEMEEEIPDIQSMAQPMMPQFGGQPMPEEQSPEEQMPEEGMQEAPQEEAQTEEQLQEE
jgi:hypothetical protein